MAATNTRVRVRAFARMRELLGGDHLDASFDGEACVRDVAALLERDYPHTAALLTVTKFARNGAVCALDDRLADGDEIALLPPVGGG